MDPEITLKEIRSLVTLILRGDGDGDDSYDLAKAFENLDVWLCKGGFKPKDWR